MTDQSPPALFPLEAVRDLLDGRETYRRGIATLLRSLGFTQETPVVVEKRQVVLTLPHDNIVHLPVADWPVIRGMLEKGSEP